MPLMFQRTSITERLHPAVPAVKTPSFFQKYFHSAVIASICDDGKPSRCSRATRWRDGAVKTHAFACVRCFFPDRSGKKENV